MFSSHWILIFALLASHLAFAEVIVDRAQIKTAEDAVKAQKPDLTAEMLMKAYNGFWIPKNNTEAVAQTITGVGSTAAGYGLIQNEDRFSKLHPHSRTAKVTGVGLDAAGLTSTSIGALVIFRAGERMRNLPGEKAAKDKELAERVAAFRQTENFQNIVEAIGKERAELLLFDLLADWDMRHLVRKYLQDEEQAKAKELLEKGREKLDAAIVPNIPNKEQRNRVIDAMLNQRFIEESERAIQWRAAIDGEKKLAPDTGESEAEKLLAQLRNLKLIEELQTEVRDEVFGRNIERNSKGVGRAEPLSRQFPKQDNHNTTHP